MIASITHDLKREILKREIPIWWLYDRSRSQCLFDPAKSLMALISESKGGILGEKLS